MRSLFASGAGPRSSFARWQNVPGFQSPSKTLLQAAWPGLSVETDTMRLWLSFDRASYEAAAPADEVIEMRRREFITGLGSTTVTWPHAAGAQQPMIPVVGFLHPGSLDTFAPLVAELRQA